MPVTTPHALKLIQELYLKNRNFCSDDYDESLRILSQELPFKIFSYTQSHNQWQVPPRWNLLKAEIRNLQGDLIYQVDHPLKIIGLSLPFKGKVSRNTLKSHLHYDHRFDDAIPYHFRQFYRPWDRDWGFCVPKTFYDSLHDDHYEVEIITDESEGSLKVAEFTHQGKTPYCFVFVAHLDHPGMVNDDLAGVIAGVELFKKIQSIETKFSYKLVLVPEIIGSEFYLHHLKESRQFFLEGCFLEMLATDAPLALQRSVNKNSQIEKALLKTLSDADDPFRQGPFKSIICNDEYVWESYQVPMCSLSRFPYEQYHTDKDDLSHFNIHHFNLSVKLLFQVIKKLEKLTLIEKKFSGVPCLSSPRYNLYVDPGERAFGTLASNKVQKLRLLMDLIPCKETTFFLDEELEKLGISYPEAYQYLKLWEDKKLIKII